MFYKVPQKWLNTFTRFIRSLENASHKCGNFTKWFQFYWDFCNKYNFPDNDTGSLPHFLHKLKEKGNDEDAISSARNTINYYYEMLELLEYHKNKKENKKTTACLSWTEAVSKLYKEIKKRGYTKSTLKTYTHWVYHFNNFISKENCLDLNTDDVQQFLEHLAVIKKVKYLSITIHLFLFFLFN